MNRIDDGLQTAKALASAMRNRDDEGFLLLWEGTPEEDRIMVVMCIARLLQRQEDSLVQLIREVDDDGQV